MNRVEFPQTISGFFGILVSRPPHQIWDLDHILMLQKSTLPLREESVLAICLLHTALTLKHPLRGWCFAAAAPHLLHYCFLCCYPWHCHCHCLICTAAPSQFCICPFLLLKWILDHPHLLSEVNNLCLSQSFSEDVRHLFSCRSVL